MYYTIYYTMSKAKNLKLKMIVWEDPRTQAEIAKEATVSTTNLSVCMRGRYMFVEDEQKRLADVLSCKVEDIF